MIWSKVWLVRPSAGQATTGTCKLIADGVRISPSWSAPTGARRVGRANLITHEFTHGRDDQPILQRERARAWRNNVKIVAIQVGIAHGEHG